MDNEKDAIINKLMQKIAELTYQNAIQAVAIDNLQAGASQADAAEQARKK